MKTQRKRHNRRGSFLARTTLSFETLKRVFDRMMFKSTVEGENNLLRTIFSH